MLSQQVIAMTAMDEWRVDDLLALIRRSTLLVLMSSGQVTSDTFPPARFIQSRRPHRMELSAPVDLELPHT